MGFALAWQQPELQPTEPVVSGCRDAGGNETKFVMKKTLGNAVRAAAGGIVATTRDCHPPLSDRGRLRPPDGNRQMYCKH